MESEYGGPKMAGMKATFNGNEQEETRKVLKQQDSTTELAQLWPLKVQTMSWKRGEWFHWLGSGWESHTENTVSMTTTFIR